MIHYFLIFLIVYIGAFLCFPQPGIAFTVLLAAGFLNLVDWTTPVIDTGSYWDAGNNKFLPTDGVARQYWIYCTLSFTTSDDIEPLVLNIQKNDNQIFYSKHTNHLETTLFGYGIADLDGIDDYLNVYVYNPTSTPYEIMVHPSKTFFGGYALDITKPFV